MPKEQLLCGRCNSVFTKGKHLQEHLETCVVIIAKVDYGITGISAPKNFYSKYPEALNTGPKLLT
jgi:hypothetical protein